MKVIPLIMEYCLFRERPIIDLLIGSLIRDSWQSLKPCDLLLVRHDANCGYSYKGKAYSPLFDSIGEKFQKKEYKIGSVAKPLSRLTAEKAFFSPVSYNQSFLKIEIFRYLLQLLKGKTYSDLWADRRHFDLWCKILEKSKPRLVIGSMPKKEICQAGKDMEIPIYDLQHGAISDQNPWYGEKFRINSNPRDLPDGFLVWDECAFETINKWVKKKDIEIIKIENPWFLRFSLSCPEDLLVQEAIRSVSIKKQDKPGILLTLQWGKKPISVDVALNRYIEPALEQVILETINKYNWIIRLHPVLLRSSEKVAVIHYLKSKFDNDIVQKWITLSEKPLPIVLKQVDLHITNSSAVVIEAGWMGIKSCILNENFNEGGTYSSFYKKERDAGLAQVIPQDPDAIKRWIEESMKSRNEPMKHLKITHNLGSWIESVISN